MSREQQLAEKPKSEMDRATKQTEYYQPAVDVSETTDGLVLRYDMPGVHKDNVDITVEGGILRVIGKADAEESGRAVYRETRVGDYRREFSLSEDVDTGHVEAEMTAGVLTIRLSKKEHARPRRIEISTEAQG